MQDKQALTLDAAPHVDRHSCPNPWTDLQRLHPHWRNRGSSRLFWIAVFLSPVALHNTTSDTTQHYACFISFQVVEYTCRNWGDRFCQPFVVVLFLEFSWHLKHALEFSGTVPDVYSKIYTAYALMSLLVWSLTYILALCLKHILIINSNILYDISVFCYVLWKLNMYQ